MNLAKLQGTIVEKGDVAFVKMLVGLTKKKEQEFTEKQALLLCFVGNVANSSVVISHSPNFRDDLCWASSSADNKVKQKKQETRLKRQS